jgi:protein SCO1/2
MVTAKRGLERALRVFLLVLAAGMAAGIAQAGTTEAPQADIQPINLIDQSGRAVTQKDFIGKPSLIFFGFTNCPSICPTALAEIAARMADLGPRAERLNVIFVTADPERDTPEVLREYLGSFDSRIVGLTGGVADVTAMAQSIGAAFRKVPLAGGGYTVDHSGHAFLMDRNWRRSGFLILEAGAQPKRAVAKLQKLIGE